MSDTVLSVHLPTQKEFWTQYFDDGHRRGIFIPHELAVPVGESAQVDIIFLDSDARFRMVGQIVWRRLKGQRRGRQAPGSALAFDAGEPQKIDRLLAYVEGRDINFIKRSSPRIQASFEVSYKAASAFVTDFARDLSEGGIFLASSQDITVGTVLPIKLRIPGRWWPVTLHGEVVRSTSEGVGVRFVFSSDRERRKISRLVSRVARQVRTELQG